MTAPRELPVAGSTRLVKSVCPLNCPDSCGMLTTVVDGRVVATIGDPDHPITRGWLCRKGNEYLERMNHPSRLLHPMRRVGPKGAGQFERCSWDEALDEIADRWKAIIAEWGGEALMAWGYSGTMGLVNRLVCERRFLNRIGATIVDKGICSEAGHAAMRATLGASIGADPEDVPNARLVLIWGYNPAATNPHFIPLLQEAKRAGATVVVIDPRPTETLRFADRWIRPYPGTDGALALAMLREIVGANLHDAGYVDRCVLGFNELVDRAPDLETASRITRVPAGEIAWLARTYASTQPAMITTGPGVQRHTNGGQAVRAMLALPAATGQFGRSGGGFLYNNRFVAWDAEATGRDSTLRVGTPRTISINHLGEALLSAEPPIKSLLVINGNPAAVAQSQDKVRRGLLRDDLFTVVHEVFPTDSVDFADIVLPSTMQLEQLDLHLSYWSLYMRLNEPAVEPPGECRSNLDVFHALAERMGFTENCLYDTGETIIRDLLATDSPYLHGISIARLRAEPAVRLNLPDRPHVPYADGVFPTPSGKIELFSASLAAVGAEPLPTWRPETESAEASPELFGRYPLKLITPKEQHFLGSSFANLDSFQRMARRPTLDIAPDDAKVRAIMSGDQVEVFNQRGWCRLTARVADTLLPGVVVSEVVPWQKLSEGGRNVNWTTPDYVTDIGANSAYHTNLVEVRRVDPPGTDRDSRRSDPLARRQ